MRMQERERESDKKDENMIYDMTSPLLMFVNINISNIVIGTIIIIIIPCSYILL